MSTGASLKKRAKARFGATAEVAPERRVPRGGRHDEARRAGTAPATRRAFSTGVRRSSSPSSSSTGTSGSGPGPNSGASGSLRPALAQVEHVARERGGAVERLELVVRDRRRARGRLAVPLARVWWRAAIPGQRRLLAGGRGVQRRAETRRSSAAPHRPRTRACAGAAAACASPGSAARTEPGKAARSTGSKSPASRIENTSTRVRRRVRAPSVPADHADRAAARAPRRSTSAARSATRVPRPGAAPAAERVKHARHGVERVEVERVRPVRLDDGVEHEALHPRRVAQGVPERDLRAVRGPVQRDLLGAELLAHRVDVVGRVAARVERPARTQPPRAVACGRPGPQEVRALQRAGSEAAPSARCRAGRRSQGRGSGTR